MKYSFPRYCVLILCELTMTKYSYSVFFCIEFKQDEFSQINKYYLVCQV